MRAFLPRPVVGPINENAWLGREDSNLRMVESKSTALPLGDAPTRDLRRAALAGGRTLKRGLPRRNCPARVFPFAATFPSRRKDLRPQAPPFAQMAATIPQIVAKASSAPLLPPSGASIRRAFALICAGCRSVAQSGSVPCSERGGRRFESYHSDHQIPETTDETGLKPGFFVMRLHQPGCARGRSRRAAAPPGLMCAFSGRTLSRGRL